jgi:hypothetical protein
MGDPGKVIAGILKGKMKDATYLERLAEERMTHDAAARRLAALTMHDDSEKKKRDTVGRESRGNCGICGKEVIAAIGGDKTKGHKRLRYQRESGRVHFHMECVADLCDEREMAVSSRGICGICRESVSDKEDRVPTKFAGDRLYVHLKCARRLCIEPAVGKG